MTTKIYISGMYVLKYQNMSESWLLKVLRSCIRFDRHLFGRVTNFVLSTVTIFSVKLFS